jgi:alpha-beta hydrolase superfamily lysophospholipase
MSTQFPQAVVSFPGRAKLLSRPQPSGQNILATGNRLAGSLGAVRFGLAASPVAQANGQQGWLNKPKAWMQQMHRFIQQAYVRFTRFVQWTTLMGGGILSFLLAPNIFRRIEGRFLLGPNTVTSLFTQKDATLRAKIKPDFFNMGDYQHELRRSGLGFIAPQDKMRLHYWYIQGKPGQPCIIYSHGRGTHIGQQEGLLKGFMQRGYGVLIYEYPGLSQGGGEVTEQRLYKAGLAASLHARQHLKIPIANQVIMGNSLGSIVAAKTVNSLDSLGLGERPKGLVMVSTFPTLNEAFRSYRSRLGAFGRLFNENRITVKLDARAALKANHQVPVLLLQGGRDKSTPYAMAAEMKQCIPEANQLRSKVVKMPQGKHKLRESDFPAIVQETDNFLQGLSPNKAGT